MNHHYRDIIDRLGTPLWWDECAVPRYCEFSPDEAANIYARQAVLLEIACQDCGTRFRVCMTQGPLATVSLAEAVRSNALNYGDPPHVGCCAAGPTMNSVPLRVLEFWDRPAWEWERNHEYEGPIDCGWAA